MKSIKIYYNGACLVCNSLVPSQKLKTTECDVQWIDIDQNASARKDIAASEAVLREKLHLMDDSDQVFKGIDAFKIIWQNSPTEHWKANVVSLPVINQLVDVGYMVFARLIYMWNRLNHRW